MCKPCDIGLMPIHVAARNASTKTLNVLLDHGKGYQSFIHSSTTRL